MQSEGERGNERGWLSDPSFPLPSPSPRRGRARYAEFGKGRNGTREGRSRGECMLSGGRQIYFPRSGRGLFIYLADMLAS